MRKKKKKKESISSSEWTEEDFELKAVVCQSIRLVSTKRLDGEGVRTWQSLTTIVAVLAFFVVDEGWAGLHGSSSHQSSIRRFRRFDGCTDECSMELVGSPRTFFFSPSLTVHGRRISGLKLIFTVEAELFVKTNKKN